MKGALGLYFGDESESSGSGNVNTTEYDSTFTLLGAIGMDIQNGFRAEAEITYTAADVKSIQGNQNNVAVNSTDVSGDLSVITLMGNVAYDFPNNSIMTPYVFGGLGLARVALNSLTFGSSELADDSDVVFAMQLGGGVSFPLDERTSLEASYRYFETQDAEFADGSNTPFEYEVSSHNFMLGARLKF